MAALPVLERSEPKHACGPAGEQLNRASATCTPDRHGLETVTLHDLPSLPSRHAGICRLGTAGMSEGTAGIRAGTADPRHPSASLPSCSSRAYTAHGSAGGQLHNHFMSNFLGSYPLQADLHRCFSRFHRFAPYLGTQLGHSVRLARSLRMLPVHPGGTHVRRTHRTPGSRARR